MIRLKNFGIFLAFFLGLAAVSWLLQWLCRVL